MIIRRALFSMLALVVLLACLAVTAPARLVALALPPGKVVAQGFSGSLWQGRASRVMVATDAGLLHLGEVHWELSPLSLLTLSPRLEISSDWGDQQLQAEVQLHGADDVTLRNLTLNADAALAQYLAPVMLRGRISFQAEYLDVRNGLPVGAQARVLWRQAAWDSPRGLLALGDYALDLQQAPGGPL
ncbi:MAG TPA: type II secretion system protein N, partial [Kineobactrum sp.]